MVRHWNRLGMLHLEKLGMPHLWQPSRPGWRRPWAISSSEWHPCHSKRLGTRLTLRSLPTLFIQWFYNMHWEYSIYCVMYLSCRADAKTIDRSLRHPFSKNYSLQMTIMWLYVNRDINTVLLLKWFWWKVFRCFCVAAWSHRKLFKKKRGKDYNKPFSLTTTQSRISWTLKIPDNYFSTHLSKFQWKRLPNLHKKSVSIWNHHNYTFFLTGCKPYKRIVPCRREKEKENCLLKMCV